MARSIRKGPHIDMKLLKKVHKMEEASSKSVIKTWARNSIILPDFVGHTFAVHNGNKFIPVFITENICLLYTSPSPRDPKSSRMPSSA